MNRVPFERITQAVTEAEAVIECAGIARNHSTLLLLETLMLRDQADAITTETCAAPVRPDRATSGAPPLGY